MAEDDTPPLVPDWTRFHGIDAPNTTATPDVVFDFIAPFLSEVELRVLLYIVRRTFGFKKTSDAIGIEQMVSGIVRKDGVRLDFGTQLSRAGVTKGLRGLREKNLVLASRVISQEHGNQPTRYTLNIRSGGPPIESVLRDVLGIAHPLLRTEHSSATDVAPPLLHAVPPSATDIAVQQTESTHRHTTGKTPAKYARGFGAVCPDCGSRPHADDCPRRHEQTAP